MDFIQLLIFSAVFILLSLMFHVFAVKVLHLPNTVKNQKPINGTHRLIEITLLISGIAAVSLFNEMYVFAGVISMLFCCDGTGGRKSNMCTIRFTRVYRPHSAYLFFYPLTDRALNPCGRSVAARVGPALEKTFVINDDRCRMSHDPVKIANRLDAVAALL